MHVLRKGEAFPQIRRRSRGSSLTGRGVIWTSSGKPYHYNLWGVYRPREILHRILPPNTQHLSPGPRPLQREIPLFGEAQRGALHRWSRPHLHATLLRQDALCRWASAIFVARLDRFLPYNGL